MRIKLISGLVKPRDQAMILISTILKFSALIKKFNLSRLRTVVIFLMLVLINIDQRLTFVQSMFSSIDMTPSTPEMHKK